MSTLALSRKPSKVLAAHIRRSLNQIDVLTVALQALKVKLSRRASSKALMRFCSKKVAGLRLLATVLEKHVADLAIVSLVSAILSIILRHRARIKARVGIRVAPLGFAKLLGNALALHSASAMGTPSSPSGENWGAISTTVAGNVLDAYSSLAAREDSRASACSDGVLAVIVACAVHFLQSASSGGILTACAGALKNVAKVPKASALLLQAGAVDAALAVLDACCRSSSGSGSGALLSPQSEEIVIAVLSLLGTTASLAGHAVLTARRTVRVLELSAWSVGVVQQCLRTLVAIFSTAEVSSELPLLISIGGSAAIVHLVLACVADSPDVVQSAETLLVALFHLIEVSREGTLQPEPLLMDCSSIEEAITVAPRCAQCFPAKGLTREIAEPSSAIAVPVQFPLREDSLSVSSVLCRHACSSVCSEWFVPLPCVCAACMTCSVALYFSFPCRALGAPDTGHPVSATAALASTSSVSGANSGLGGSVGTLSHSGGAPSSSKENQLASSTTSALDSASLVMGSSFPAESKPLSQNPLTSTPSPTTGVSVTSRSTATPKLNSSPAPTSIPPRAPLSTKQHSLSKTREARSAPLSIVAGRTELVSRNSISALGSTMTSPPPVAPLPKRMRSSAGLSSAPASRSSARRNSTSTKVQRPTTTPIQWPPQALINTSGDAMRRCAPPESLTLEVSRLYWKHVLTCSAGRACPSRTYGAWASGFFNFNSASAGGAAPPPVPFCIDVVPTKVHAENFSPISPDVRALIVSSFVSRISPHCRAAFKSAKISRVAHPSVESFVDKVLQAPQCVHAVSSPKPPASWSAMLGAETNSTSEGATPVGTNARKSFLSYGCSHGGNTYAPSYLPLKFESNFECGNLASAIRVGDCEYDLTLNCDTGLWYHAQWFYFSVSGPGIVADREYRFNILNLEKPASLFNSGASPVMLSETEMKKAEANEESRPWQYNGRYVTYFRNHYNRQPRPSQAEGAPAGTYSTLTFTFTFPHSNDRVWIASAIPFSYSQLQSDLSRIALVPYVMIQPLCRTLGGNVVHCITIAEPSDPAVSEALNSGPKTSDEDVKLPKIAPERSERGHVKDVGEPLDESDDAAIRAKAASIASEMSKRPVVIISARVHPGEPPASWMCRGLLRYLLGSSADAVASRRTFVWKIVPMLNPDGVIVGNTRTSLASVDLNRQWADASPTVCPPIFSLRRLIHHMSNVQNRKIYTYCDFHGHSRRQGVFLYGCRGSAFPEDLTDVGTKDKESSTGQGKVRSERAFVQCIAASMPMLVPENCSFKVQKNKESTARIVAFRALGIRLSFTLESSMCGGYLSSKDRATLFPAHYSAEDFETAGIGFASGVYSFYQVLPHNNSAQLVPAYVDESVTNAWGSFVAVGGDYSDSDGSKEDGEDAGGDDDGDNDDDDADDADEGADDEDDDDDDGE